MSKCFSPVVDKPNVLRILEFVTVPMLSFLAMSWASGCGGASTTQIYPLKPFSKSHSRSAEEVEIDIVMGKTRVESAKRVGQVSCASCGVCDMRESEDHEDSRKLEFVFVKSSGRKQV